MSVCWPRSRTDDEGRFDFGPRPATRYGSVAQARTWWRRVVLELRARDPRPPPGDVTIEHCATASSHSGSSATRPEDHRRRAGSTPPAAPRCSPGCLRRTGASTRWSAGRAGSTSRRPPTATAPPRARAGGRRAAAVDSHLPEVAIAGRVVDQAGAAGRRGGDRSRDQRPRPGQLTESVDTAASASRAHRRDTYRWSRATTTGRRHDGHVAPPGPPARYADLERRATLTRSRARRRKAHRDATVVAHSTRRELDLGSAGHAGRRPLRDRRAPRGQVKLEVESTRIRFAAATTMAARSRRARL